VAERRPGIQFVGQDGRNQPVEHALAVLGGLGDGPARVVIFSTTSPMCGANIARSSDGARRRWRRVRAGRGWRAAGPGGHDLYTGHAAAPLAAT
jgi:hypothetical protein